ncbi:MAG: sugar phosphate isomerase/epimerase family protein [Pirellulales bacterium]
MSDHTTRRDFLSHSARFTAGLALAGAVSPHALGDQAKAPLYKISCTEYSLHRMIGGGKLDNLEYAPFVKKEFNLDAVEYWNQPFFDKAEDDEYIADMRKRADDAGVSGTVILIDGEGNLGDPDEKQRVDAVNRHKKWVLCAKQLGCHSIRVNAGSAGSYDEQLQRAADGLRRLSEFAASHEMSVIVENHGGLSSNGEWLAAVMKRVGLDSCGTLPDFGNFGNYDRYQGVQELMPYAKSVSAKSHDFDAEGNETHTDYLRMMKIVVDAGFNGYVGIEFEGGRLSEVEGVKATKKLLERVRDQLAKS